MTCVVTERCVGCRYGECVTACPVNAFRIGPNFVVIDPKVCVNCTTCVIVCPIGAIASTYDLTPDQKYLIAENARLAEIFPPASGPVTPLSDADAWALETDKACLFK
jgi:ferredoxin